MRYRKLVSFFGSISIYLGFLYLLRDYLNLSAFNTHMGFFTIGSGILAISIWLVHGGFYCLDRKSKKIFVFWIFCVLWMIIVPFIFYDYKVNFLIFSEGLHQDYRYVMYVTLAFIYIDPKMYLDYDKLMKRVGKLAIITGLIGLIMAEKDPASILNRINVWKLPYYLWWFSSCIFAYWFFRASYGIKEKWGYWVVIVYVVLGLIFLKRVAFVNLGILVLTLVFLKGNVSNIVKITLSVVFTLVFSFLLFSKQLTFLSDRFQSDAENLENWDRNMEQTAYYSSIHLKNIILGHGINNYHSMEFLSREFTVNALHIGAFNIQYKGGIIYILFNLYLLYNIWKVCIINSKNKVIFISAGVGISFFFSCFYEMSWTYTPIPFFYFVSILNGFKYIKS